ncbi:hypothetical protein [Mesorhizobium muleiense]|uniref:Uncharacterized protein n=1 Tax=Mesorhizobium muleiense TaxID=1004279 RepID=A0A1G8LBR8_9HYPH|nr:hypothetical protein [Mesorhizobium muleiense]MCF6100361.1 hypothetical protein [Mesorhizobium muleiense]SDI53144.1 hypothetical protein SAMN05428953_102201 [Mesorhizobium muleiense]
MQWLEIIVDLLKGIAWPAAILIVAQLFSSDIRAILPRLRKAGPSGVELDAPEQQQRIEPPSSGIPDDPDLPVPTAALAILEERLRKQIETKPEAKRQPILLRELAISRLITLFERVHRLIFGSQIDLLKSLNLTGPKSMELVRPYYDEAAILSPDFYKDYDFDKWLSFLTSAELVEIKDGQMDITETGREFLVYMVNTRLIERKPG